MTEFIRKYWNLNLSEYFENRDFEINKLLLVLAVGLCAACLVSSLFNGKIALLLKKLLRASAFSEEEAKSLSELRLDGDRILRKMLGSKTGKLSHFVRSVGETTPTYEEYMAAERAEKEAKKAKRRAFFARVKGVFVKKKTSASEAVETAPTPEREEPKNSPEREEPKDGQNAYVRAPTDPSPARYYIPAEEKNEAKRFFENDRSSPLRALLLAVLIFSSAVILALLMPSILTLVQSILSI